MGQISPKNATYYLRFPRKKIKTHLIFVKEEEKVAYTKAQFEGKYVILQNVKFRLDLGFFLQKITSNFTFFRDWRV